MKSLYLYSALGAVAVALAVPAFAQTEPASGPDVKNANSLGDIIVTAQRFKENVQRVPISMAVVTGQTLQNEGKNSLDQALRDVPAIDIQASPQGGQVFIRGVGNNGDNNVVDSDVALMFDGVYSGRAETALANAFDIDRVEVLRGPQGTLYGRNATGGVVNILSNDPGFKLGAGVNLDAGGYNLEHIDGYVNVPLGDKLSVRFAGLRELRDGYFSNGGGASDAVGARAKILYKPSPKLSLLATFDYLQTKGLGATSVLAPGNGQTANAPFGNVNNPSSNPWDTTASVPFPYQVAADQDDYRFYTYSLKAEYDMGWGVLTVIPAYVHSNRTVSTQIFAPGPRTTGTVVEDQYTLEARIASPAASKIKWVAGVYALKDDNAAPLSATTGGNAYYLFTPTKRPATSYAAFGQMTYPVSDVFRLTGGLRYNQDKKSETYGVCTTTNGTSCDGIYTSPEIAESSTYGALTFKAGMEYDVAPRSMLYAQVASGYKAGGYDLDTPPTAYQPEHLLAFEIGSKNRFLDNKLQVNLEAYYYSYSNYQVTASFTIPYTSVLPPAYCTGACATSTQFQMGVLNAATGKNYGGEIEVHYQPTKNDRFDVSLALIHATYGALSVPNPGFPGNGPPGTGQGGDPYSITGDQVASTPNRVLNLGYTHTFVLPFGSIDVHGQSKISSGYYDTIFEANSASYQPSFTRSDANITYKNGDGHWRLGLWVKNIENKAQVTNNFPFFRVMITDPRTWGVNLSANF